MAGVLTVLLGLLAGVLQARDTLGAVVTIFSSFVMAALFIAIADIRDVSHATWKKVSRIEEEMSSRSRRR